MIENNEDTKNITEYLEVVVQWLKDNKTAVIALVSAGALFLGLFGIDEILSQFLVENFVEVLNAAIVFAIALAVFSKAVSKFLEAIEKVFSK